MTTANRRTRARRIGLIALTVGVVSGSGCASDEIRPPFVKEKAAPVGAIAGRIVVTTRGDSTYALGSLDADNEKIKGVAKSEGARSPAYSPDGRTIAAGYDAGGRGGIAIFNGRTRKALVEAPGYFDHPSWSPDGTQLAYAHHPADGSWDVYVLDVATKETDVLVSGDSQDWYPSWSPSGDRIAFTSDRDGDNAVWLADVNSGELTKLVDSLGQDSEPAWSPDGQTIAFASDRELETWQIHLVDPDGSSDRTLIRSETVDRYPVYSPDGRFILVSTGYLAAYAADGGELSNGADRWKIVDQLTYTATWTDE